MKDLRVGKTCGAAGFAGRTTFGWPAMGGQTFCYACRALSDTFRNITFQIHMPFPPQGRDNGGFLREKRLTAFTCAPTRLFKAIFHTKPFGKRNFCTTNFWDHHTNCFRCEKNFITTVFFDTTTFRPRQPLRPSQHFVSKGFPFVWFVLHGVGVLWISQVWKRSWEHIWRGGRVEVESDKPPKKTIQSESGKRSFMDFYWEIHNFTIFLYEIHKNAVWFCPFFLRPPKSPLLRLGLDGFRFLVFLVRFVLILKQLRLRDHWEGFGKNNKQNGGFLQFSNSTNRNWESLEITWTSLVSYRV